MHVGQARAFLPAVQPTANSIAERIVRTIRTECLDHLIVIDERHLARCWPSSPITTIATDHIAASGFRAPFPAASEPVAGCCHGESCAACTTSMLGPLECGRSFAALRASNARLR